MPPLPGYAVNVNVRYVSMRVHGTSAHVQYDPPDSPVKQLIVERIPQGTMVTSNYTTGVSVHFSIPTPLIVDRVQSIVPPVVDRDPNDREVAHVFDGASVWVHRVAIDLGTTKHDAIMGSIEVWDGGRRLFHAADASSLVLLAQQLDAFLESPNPTRRDVIEVELDKRVYSGLGVTLNIRLQAESDRNRFLVHTARAVFSM